MNSSSFFSKLFLPQFSPSKIMETLVSIWFGLSQITGIILPLSVFFTPHLICLKIIYVLKNPDSYKFLSLPWLSCQYKPPTPSRWGMVITFRLHSYPTNDLSSTQRPDQWFSYINQIISILCSEPSNGSPFHSEPNSKFLEWPLSLQTLVAHYLSELKSNNSSTSLYCNPTGLIAVLWTFQACPLPQGLYVCCFFLLKIQDHRYVLQSFAWKWISHGDLFKPRYLKLDLCLLAGHFQSLFLVCFSP